MKGTFHIFNFGCKVNQEEGAALAALFLSKGWQQGETEEADLFIVNTCTVTAMADKKSRNLIRRLRKEHPNSILAVCGCYAQRAPEEILALQADIVAGVDERVHLPELVDAFRQEQPLLQVGDVSKAQVFQQIAKESQQARARAYLKIEDGCDQFCHYCIIPYVRGPVRSLPFTEAVQEAEKLVAAGHKEIVLTGIHIGAYGQDFGEKDLLPRLIHALCQMPDLVRLRLGSVEPLQFSEALIEALQEKKVCRHLHIPLQAGCDRTLAAMGRNYDTETYRRLVKELREKLGDLALSSDVMVGYPGESPADFAQSLAFCQEIGFASLHVFPYSRRQGTPAATAPGQISQRVKAERAAALALAGEEMQKAYLQRQLGQTMQVIVEEEEIIDGVCYQKGHSDEYVMVYLPEQLPAGSVVEAKALSLLAEGIKGERWGKK